MGEGRSWEEQILGHGSPRLGVHQENYNNNHFGLPGCAAPRPVSLGKTWLCTCGPQTLGVCTVDWRGGEKTQAGKYRGRPGVVALVALQTTVGGDLGLSLYCRQSLLLVASLCPEGHYGVHRMCWHIKATAGCSTRKWQRIVFYRRCTGFPRVTLTPIFASQLTLNNSGVKGIDHPCSQKYEYNF